MVGGAVGDGGPGVEETGEVGGLEVGRDAVNGVGNPRSGLASGAEGEAEPEELVGDSLGVDLEGSGFRLVGDVQGAEVPS